MIGASHTSHMTPVSHLEQKPTNALDVKEMTKLQATLSMLRKGSGSLSVLRPSNAIQESQHTDGFSEAWIIRTVFALRWYQTLKAPVV